jgi:hypothetical protein
MEDTMNSTSRRSLLKRASAIAGSAIVFPAIVPSSALGADAPSKRAALGHIGVGGQGSGLLQGFLGVAESQSIAVGGAIAVSPHRAAPGGGN